MLPRAAAREGVEVLHCPANFAPLHGPFARVLTLHDLIFRRLPGTVSTPLRWGTEATVPPAARRAHRIITGSDAARDDIVAELKLKRELIDVIPHGIAAPPPVPEAAVARMRERLGRAAGARSRSRSPPTSRTRTSRCCCAASRCIAPEERPLLVFAGFGTDAGELPGARERARPRATTSACSARWRRTTSRRSTPRPTCSSPRRSTRASGCRCSRRWRAASSSPARTCRSLREVAGDDAELLDPHDPRLDRRRAAAAALGRRRPRAPARGRARARRPLHLGARRRRRRCACFDEAVAARARR